LRRVLDRPCDLLADIVANRHRPFGETLDVLAQARLVQADVDEQHGKHDEVAAADDESIEVEFGRPDGETRRRNDDECQADRRRRGQGSAPAPAHRSAEQRKNEVG
jgi:hypothetical protein